MNQVNMLACNDDAEIRQKGKVIRESGGRGDGRKWYVVYLQAGQKPANPHPVWRMTVCDHDHLRAWIKLVSLRSDAGTSRAL
jgi:hypothetical protein